MVPRCTAERLSYILDSLARAYRLGPGPLRLLPFNLSYSIQGRPYIGAQSQAICQSHMTISCYANMGALAPVCYPFLVLGTL